MQIIWLAGCSEKSFNPIERERDFIASLNIQEPSLDFIDEQGNVFTTWSFEKAYSGALLLGDDRVLLYGHQLDKIDVYTLSTGKKLYSKKGEDWYDKCLLCEKCKPVFLSRIAK